MSPLEGKVALVTGAGRGIGRAIAERLASRGALVAINYLRDEAAAREALATVEAAGGSAFLLQGDVSEPASVVALIAGLDRELRARAGKPGFDILVNNAAQGKGGVFPRVAEEDYDRVMRINARGPLFLTQALLPLIRDGGRIINISSGASAAPRAEYISYSMSKAALDAATVAMAGALGPRGITVNAVSPGPTITAISERMQTDAALAEHITSTTAMGRFGRPEDIAGIVAFLASDEGNWVTGQRIDVSGGRGLLSGIRLKPGQ